jgi:hypothetical protein
MHYPDPSELEVHGEDSLVVLEREKDRLDEALKAVHNARVGHGGIRRTWLLLNDTFPGHKISVEAVADFISTACQKYRLGMSDSLPAPLRGLSIEHRHTCGYDTLYVTPEDKLMC